MKLAFVYAGQGSQHVGMGKDFYEEFPLFAQVFDHAPVDFDLKQLCFEGPEEKLAQTRYTQPCMAAFAVGVTDLLYQEGIRPQLAAGLSLGEYSALYAAGVFSRGTVISTVALRGRAMEEAAAGLDCSMTAVLGLERKKLQEACDGAAELGVVQICNYNCPGQLVIGGEKAAVDRAGELAKELGAKRCMPLKVSGPFHTRLMKPAGDVLAAHFKTIDFQPMALPVYFNCKGGPMESGDTIPALLEKQVQSSVYWEDTIRRMEADGIDTVVEIGPGKALCGFFKKTAPGIKTYHIDTAADFHSVVSALKGETA
ncbi:Malonyl CoA-acyl carrier protein transacylase [Firmicutes bacterium ASF500]|nr:Malonyl CoA-acyl carrier protein transacylase [Firmicutes bacterium ASF500]